MKRYYYYVIAVIIFLLDQATKKLITANLEVWEQIPVIGDFFLITHVLNDGAAFSMLKGASVFFIVVTILVTVGIVWYLEKNKRTAGPLLLLGLGLVLGGALGNFADRLLLGHVIDFLQFNFGSWTFPIFNVADMGITFGVIFILLDTMLETRKEALITRENGELPADDRLHGNGTEADESAR